MWPIFWLLICLTATNLAALPTKPNIILILVDDLGLGEVNAQEPNSGFTYNPLSNDTTWGKLPQLPRKLKYPLRTIVTPHLAQFAKQGTRLLSSFSPSSVCAPSRASIFLGRHVGTLQVRDNEGILVATDSEVLEPMFSKLMRNEGGYDTGYVGKWGLGTMESAPWNQGYNYFSGQMTHREAHMKFPTQITEFKNSNIYLVPIPGNDPSNLTTTRKVWSEATCALNPTSTCVYVNDVFRQKAMGFIQNARRPFFLVWAPTQPHSGKYFLEGRQTSPVKILSPWRIGTDNVDKRGHASEIEQHLDKDVKTLMDYLNANPTLDKNTLVVFTSDNGPQGDEDGFKPPYFYGTTGLRGIKRSMYQGGYHVPTIIRWTGVIKPNGMLRAPHALYDLAWTFLEVAQVNSTSLKSTGEGGKPGGGISLL